MPFAVWLAVTVVRGSRRPFRDFLMVGVLYGLSLVIIHQVLWTAGPSLRHNPPASAGEFADQFCAPTPAESRHLSRESAGSAR